MARWPYAVNLVPHACDVCCCWALSEWTDAKNRIETVRGRATSKLNELVRNVTMRVADRCSQFKTVDRFSTTLSRRRARSWRLTGSTEPKTAAPISEAPGVTATNTIISTFVVTANCKASWYQRSSVGIRWRNAALATSTLQWNGDSCGYLDTIFDRHRRRKSLFVGPYVH